MGINDKTETIGLVLDPDQIESMFEDITKALNAGAKTVILMVSNNKEHQALLNKALWTYNLEDVPQPDVIVHDSIFTIGLNMPTEEVMKSVEFWSGEVDHERPN